MATGLPTLSQIQSWDVEHLIDAANHWEATADRWDSAFGDIWQQSIDMDWQGAANDALMDRTTADKTLVAGKSEPLREAAKIARVGAGDIDAAKRAALYKVDDTREAGFMVGEDLSVTDTRSSKNAAAQAERPATSEDGARRAAAARAGVMLALAAILLYNAVISTGTHRYIEYGLAAAAAVAAVFDLRYRQRHRASTTR